MSRHAPNILGSVFALLSASYAGAQQNSVPPVDTATAESMHMTPEEMRNMPQGPRETTAEETHAPAPALERPAASQYVRPPMMRGMDTDMNDAGLIHRAWFENLEGIYGTKNGGAWDAQAWVGGDFNKFYIKSEGAILDGKTLDSKVEVLWARAILPFWDSQFGVRHDFSGGASRKWAAFGVQGIFPYWVDVELTGYLGEAGRTAVRLKTEYDLYLTQRLILKPEIELNAYGKADRARRIEAGLSDGLFEMRMRYEFTRRLAPYVGYVYDRRFAGSASVARQSGELAVDHRIVAGMQFFF